MSKKEGYSVEGLFGTIKHFDSKGHKIGESVPSLFGGYNNYDSKGHKIGETRPGFLGYNTYDNKGHKTGSSMQGFLGTNHYDAHGHRVGTSMPGFIGTNNYGNGSSDVDLVNRASAAAAMEHDTLATGIGIIAAQNAIDAEYESNRYEPTAQPSAPTKFTPQAKAAKPVRYIITRAPGEENNRYYLCQLDVSIGDRVFVQDYNLPLKVMAVVECEVSALPQPPAKMFSVLRLLH